MQLGFVSAILPDQSLEEVLATAHELGYGCVEVMCWPTGKADRRYAGVSHIDVSAFGEQEAAAVRALTAKYGVSISTHPAVWRRLFAEFPSLGLNFDPSHLISLMIDVPRAVREFGSRIIHVHAKDARLDHDKLYEVGTLGLDWHTPKIPGLGDVNW